MPRHGNTLSLDQHANLFAAVVKALPRHIHPRVAHVWEQDGEGLTKALIDVLCSKIEINKHGHFVLTIEGMDLTGEQELERLTSAGFQVRGEAETCLRSLMFDMNHCLLAGRKYKVPLMPAGEIESYKERTASALLARGIERYGYQRSPAGIIPRIRECLSDKQMQAMEITHIVAPHIPIKDGHGRSNVLASTWCDVAKQIKHFWWDADSWVDSAVCAFLEKD